MASFNAYMSCRRLIAPKGTLSGSAFYDVIDKLYHGKNYIRAYAVFWTRLWYVFFLLISCALLCACVSLYAETILVKNTAGDV